MPKNRPYDELHKIVTSSKTPMDYINHYYETIAAHVRFRGNQQKLIKKREEIKKRQSELGREMTMLQIERIALDSLIYSEGQDVEKTRS